MGGNELGTLLRGRREQAIDPLTGRAYTQDGLAQAIGVSREGISAFERGQTATLSPDIANRLSRVLSLSVADICRAMGYDIEAAALSQEEAEVVQVLRRLPDEARSILVDMLRGAARGALSTPVRPAPTRYPMRGPRPSRRVADEE